MSRIKTMDTGTSDRSFGKGYYEAEERGDLKRTANACGWQMNSLDEFSITFIEEVKKRSHTCSRPSRIADLGMAYGYSTKKLLEQTNAVIIANDLSEVHLNEFHNSLSEQEQKRLILKPGCAVDLEIAENSLDGVQALRWMHLIRVEQIRRSFENYARWLKPGGVLCVTAASPYIAIAAPLALPEYLRRKERNEEWPGEITADIRCWPEGINCEHGYLFDKDVMTREAQLAGFKVIRCEFIEREFAFTNGRENVGLLAEKT